MVCRAGHSQGFPQGSAGDCCAARGIARRQDRRKARAQGCRSRLAAPSDALASPAFVRLDDVRPLLGEDPPFPMARTSMRNWRDSPPEHRRSAPAQARPVAAEQRWHLDARNVDPLFHADQHPHSLKVLVQARMRTRFTGWWIRSSRKISRSPQVTVSRRGWRRLPLVHRRVARGSASDCGRTFWRKAAAWAWLEIETPTRCGICVASFLVLPHGQCSCAFCQGPCRRTPTVSFIVKCNAPCANRR